MMVRGSGACATWKQCLRDGLDGDIVYCSTFTLEQKDWCSVCQLVSGHSHDPNPNKDSNPYKDPKPYTEPNPYAKDPNPYKEPNPYAKDPNPYKEPNPYAKGPNPKGPILPKDSLLGKGLILPKDPARPGQLKRKVIDVMPSPCRSRRRPALSREQAERIYQSQPRSSAEWDEYEDSVESNGGTLALDDGDGLFASEPWEAFGQFEHESAELEDMLS